MAPSSPHRALRDLLPLRFVAFAVWLVAVARILLLASANEQLHIGPARPSVGVLYDAFALALLVAVRLLLGILPLRALRVALSAALSLVAVALVAGNQAYVHFFREPMEPHVLVQAAEGWQARSSLTELLPLPVAVLLVLVPLLLALWSLVVETRVRRAVDRRLAVALAVLLASGGVCNWLANIRRPYSPDARPHMLRTNVLLRWAGAALARRKAEAADTGPRLPVQKEWLTRESVLRDFPLEEGSTSLGLDAYPMARHRSVVGRDERLRAAGVDVEALAKLGDRPNVVLVILESMRAAEMGTFGAADSVSPNLDRLAKEGLVVDRFYASSYQSIRGSFALQCGFYPNPFGQEYLALKPELSIPCWHEILRGHGYDTHWFSGHYGTFEHEGTFDALHGVNSIVDLADYPKDAPKVSWGVLDHVVYARVLESLHSARPPFTATLTLIGSHHPFNYPQGMEGVRRFDFDGIYGRYLSAMSYADWAVGRFMEAARKERWFENTVFVFTGDHGIYEFPEEKDAVRKGGEPDSDRRLELFFRSPFIVYGPRFIRPGRLARTGSHVDFVPTVLDLTNIEADGAFAGASLFRDTPGRRVMVAGIGAVHGIEDERRCFYASTTPSCVRYDAGDLFLVARRPVEDGGLSAWAVRAAAVGQSLAFDDRLFPPRTPPRR